MLLVLLLPRVLLPLGTSTAGHLCRDDGPDGLRFFKNFFLDPNLVVSS